MKIKSSPYSNVLAVLLNLVLVYVLYMVTRVAFILENWSLFSVDWNQLSMGELLAGSLRFDSSAILYTNWLWIILMLLPLHHIFGIAVTYLMLANGVALGVCPDFLRLYDAAERFRVNFIAMVAALAEILVQKIERRGKSAEDALG
jgi:hypothetical protein